MTLPAANIGRTFFLVNSIDPTRTITLRHRFVADMRARFASLLADIKEAVINLDVLALSQEQQRPVINASGLSTRQFDFPRSDRKVEEFVKWLRSKNQEYLLSSRRKRTGINIFTDQLSTNPSEARDSWISTFIDSAYQQGIRRARQELKRKGIEIDDGAFGGDGIQVAFNGPIHADRVGLIYTRAYSSLQSITAEMESVVSDVLAMGIADGKGPREIARLLDKAITGRGESMAIVDSLGRKIPALRRAEILARTEVIRAHHSANIGEYKAAGMMGIQIQAEHLTAGDERVCPKCAPLNGKLYSIEEAEYIIPVHPQCRCVALPYIPDDTVEEGKLLTLEVCRVPAGSPQGGQFAPCGGPSGSTGGGSKKGKQTRLTDREKWAIDSYTGDSFFSLNRELRAGVTTSSLIAPLDSAIAKSTIQPNTTLYRKIDRDAARLVFGNNINAGQEITDKAYQSTSKSPSFGGLGNFGGVMLKIKVKNKAKGLDISKLSRNKHEGEVLLPRNSKMKVVSIKSPKTIGEQIIVTVTYGE